MRLAQLTAALSLAVDLATAQPMEHVARSCLLARRFGRGIGLDEQDGGSLYYLAQLGWAGCIADSAHVSSLFGDDLEYRAGSYDVDMAPLPFLGYLLRRANAGDDTLRGLRVSASLVATGARSIQDDLRSHCLVAADLARRLGVGEDVATSLQQTFARWDGKGLPQGLGGSAIALPVRIWQIADVAEVHHRRRGLAAVLDEVRRRRGSHFDPDLAEEFVAAAPRLFAELPQESTWDDLIAEAPSLRPELGEDELDRALEVFSDYADLKSPCYRGHSRGVAALAEAAAVRLGLPTEDVTLVRRAGLVHDIGRVGVPNSIWDTDRALTTAERERARLHAYYTQRVLMRPPPLARIGHIAGLAHERLDGSGYPHGLLGSAIPRPARILAVADRYHSLVEDRPHRPALAAPAAAERVRAEQARGALDPAAVDAVLASVGHPVRRPAGGPRGLTAREVEVLTALAKGASNRQIARQLGITPRTVGSHVEHIYAKADVTTRASATLFAMSHGLLRSLEPDARADLSPD